MRRLALSIAALSLTGSVAFADDVESIRVGAASDFADIAHDTDASPEVRVRALYALRSGSFNTPRIEEAYFAPGVEMLSGELSIQKWCMQFLAERHTDLKLSYFCSNLIIENYFIRRLMNEGEEFINELASQDPPDERLTATDVLALKPEDHMEWLYTRFAKRLDMTRETFVQATKWLRYLESNYFVEHLLDLEKGCIPYLSDTIYGLQSPSGLSRRDAVVRINEATPLDQLAELPATMLPLALQSAASITALAELGPQECKG